MKKDFLAIILTLITTGCSTGRLVVNSSPEGSDVFVKKAGSEVFENIGQTPLSSEVSDVRKRIGDSDIIVVETRKKGHISKSLVVTDVDSNSDIRLDFKLPTIDAFLTGTDSSLSETQKRILSKRAEKQLIETNQLVDSLFEAQRLVQVGRYQDALTKLEGLEKKHPEVAAIYEIRGGVAYMNKDYIKALDDYRKASRNNPFNLEVINMRNFLEKKVGEDRSPAGGIQ
jgi:tetratricopeptide (TPR) repeat protein